MGLSTIDRVAGFEELDRNDEQSWVAENHKKGWAFVGYSPEEAVAKLWLKLQEKDD